MAGVAQQHDPIDLLRGIEQNSNQTVGVLLGISAQAVAMRYHRALKRLREKLGDTGELIETVRGVGYRFAE